MEKTKSYEYTITFKVVDSSDTSKEKTIDVKVNICKAQFITKTEIEAMIKSMGTVSFLATDDRTSAQFNFSGEDKTFENTKPNFEVKKETGGTIIESLDPYGISAASDAIVKKLKETEKYKEYFSDCNKKHHENNENEKHNLTLYF